MICNRHYIGEGKTVKRLLAILSCLLFAGQAIAVQPLPSCTAQTVRACACCCGNVKMNCCAAKPTSRLPATPARTISQNQFLILTLTAMAFTPTPFESARHNFSSADFPSTASAVPIFQRDCAILI